MTSRAPHQTNAGLPQGEYHRAEEGASHQLQPEGQPAVTRSTNPPREVFASRNGDWPTPCRITELMGGIEGSEWCEGWTVFCPRALGATSLILAGFPSGTRISEAELPASLSAARAGVLRISIPPGTAGISTQHFCH